MGANFGTLVITTYEESSGKHSLFIVGKVCLHHRYIAKDVIQLLLAYSLPRECVYRVVA
jgi:hypothetical protein